MENFFYFIGFILILSINFFLKKKNLPKRVIENEQRKKISDVHKQIRNSQKTYRKTDEKKYYNIQEYFNNENSKKTINDSFNKEFNEKNADIFEKNKLILLNKKTLKEAMIFKEILETPVSLR